jgi:GMP synthase-like glutamine amidotransferase
VPTALVLANRDDADPGLVGEALVEHGFRMITLAREDADAAWPVGATPDADLLLVLGSDWSVYSETVRGPVTRERELLSAAVDTGTPVLAICFGAQLLAVTLGGEARPAARTELGWLDVDVAPVADGLIEPGPWFQFHSDTFTVPPGATLLAQTDVGPQAFRAGSALAVQFHPEVTPEIVTRWTTSDPEPVARAGLTADELVARTASEQPRARRAASRLVEEFLTSAA